MSTAGVENQSKPENSEENLEVTDRPKRSGKPTIKVIECKLVEASNKLNNIWKRCLAHLSKLGKEENILPDVLKKQISEARDVFEEYQLELLQIRELCAGVHYSEVIEELTVLEETALKRKEYLDSKINDANERIKICLLETRSGRSETISTSSVNSVRSARIKAKAHAKAALKKAEIQKRRLEIETKSAIMLEEEEMALARKRRNEHFKLAALRLDEEAQVALAAVEALDEEIDKINFEEERSVKLERLPVYNTKQRVEEYINYQMRPAPVNNSEVKPENINPELPPQNSQPEPVNVVSFLNPQAPVFSAVSQEQSTINTIEFLARRELISKKIEKFDDRPENFSSWKGSLENMMRGVKLSASEQLSLIIEYSTNESKKLAQRLRNAYIYDPGEGLKRVWEKLGERFGSDAVLTEAQLDKLSKFPQIKDRDNKQLQEFGDLLLELQCAKISGGLKGLDILDSPLYLKPIVSKLPRDLQSKWQSRAFKYKTEQNSDYPPFEEFSKFVQEISKQRNDPLLALDSRENLLSRTQQVDHSARAPKSRQPHSAKRNVSVAKTNLQDNSQAINPQNWCLVHNKPHPLRKCRTFQAKPHEEKMSILAQNRVCFRCVASCSHYAKDCTNTLKCAKCSSGDHVTALHLDNAYAKPEIRPCQQNHDAAVKTHGEEHAAKNVTINTNCAAVCDKHSDVAGKSCAKICLANVYSAETPNNKVKAYVVIDEQSNFSLGRSELFDKLKVFNVATPYTLKTCSGVKFASGRRAQGLVIESIDETVKYPLPTLTECNDIPNNRDEIPTPNAARAHKHLRKIADKIPELDNKADILLLIGRDVPPLHKVHESINGPVHAPWGQRLDLGWVVLGNACLNGAHESNGVNSYKTQVLHNGRPSLLIPCPNRFHVNYDVDKSHCYNQENVFGHNVFIRTPDDNRPGPSVEDRRFLEIMHTSMRKDSNGSWEAPLPLRGHIGTLPDSRENAIKRLRATRRILDKNTVMKEQYFAFMQKIFDMGHAETAPPLDSNVKRPTWFLPSFGVYHPRKKDKIRVVFDSAAECEGVSLNKLLLSGPDLTNNLLGVLMRFRQEPIAIVADIEQMFHSFKVTEEHRDLLRFLWYKNNDPDGEIVEYRMKVHVFGNTSSPAVANYGLRKTAELGEEEFGADTKAFVHNNFYVDDGLYSTPDPKSAIDLLHRTQAMLATANLRLHKFASNSAEVMEAFSPNDRATGLRDLNHSISAVPTQRSLGVHWDLESDSFTFRVSAEGKPFSRRGVLSVTNSLYDPLGIAAPVTIKGKSLLRSMSAELNASQPNGWDTPLPEEHKVAWDVWRESLHALESLKVPRSYSTHSLKSAANVELHTFCDASEMAIAAVSYLKVEQLSGEGDVAFVLGKAKLTPAHATSMPRLELCAAVLAVELADAVTSELEVKPNEVMYYSDSKVVIGYITNESRRFYVYVANRVERIHRSSTPQQWRYVPTHLNPADLATRSVDADKLQHSSWLKGPQFLHQQSRTPDVSDNTIAEILPEDPEVRHTVNVSATKIESNRNNLGSYRFNKFSKWSKLQAAMAKLITRARTLHKGSEQQQAAPTAIKEQAKIIIIKAVQEEAFSDELDKIKNKKRLFVNSPLSKLNPTLDKDGLLRVGGRLGAADLCNAERHPIILPRKNHVSDLIVQYYHERVQHQGRVFTHGSIRSNGYWILGGKRLTNSIIGKCIKCKKVRGKRQMQQMAELPVERVTPAPPFSYVGLDVFGPWQVCARRTRGGLAQAKRWAVLFTCMGTRAIHIEIIESMDSSSFINALRRFLAIRGPALQLRSDCGTNFTGAVHELQGAMKSSDISAVQKYLLNEGCEWVFNPPHASHAGGVWERMIGVARRILESMLEDISTAHLTHEVLTTLMAEVTAIVNARPLLPVSSDPNAPELLTPAMLLTQKTQPLGPTAGEFNANSLYGKQWERVQHLANTFWTRWRKEYLPLLQPRRIWRNPQPNLEEGDVVLLRDKDLPRNNWPLARIQQAEPDQDGKVRKVTVVTAQNGTKNLYRRPVTEVILLIKNGE